MVVTSLSIHSLPWSEGSGGLAAGGALGLGAKSDCGGQGEEPVFPPHFSRLRQP